MIGLLMPLRQGATTLGNVKNITSSGVKDLLKFDIGEVESL